MKVMLLGGAIFAVAPQVERLAFLADLFHGFSMCGWFAHFCRYFWSFFISGVFKVDGRVDFSRLLSICAMITQYFCGLGCELHCESFWRGCREDVNCTKLIFLFFFIFYFFRKFSEDDVVWWSYLM